MPFRRCLVCFEMIDFEEITRDIKFLHTTILFSGEARANQRKGKLIFFYEWEITLKWKGFANGKGETEITGKVVIPNLSEEHDDMNDVDIDIEVVTGKGSPEGQALKEMMRKGLGAKTIREKLQGYVEALKTEYSQDIILPAKGQAQVSQVNKTSNLTIKSRIFPRKQFLGIDFILNLPISAHE